MTVMRGANSFSSSGSVRFSVIAYPPGMLRSVDRLSRRETAFDGC
jgi:hypothetical protein